MATNPCGVDWADAERCWPIRRRPLESGTTTSSVGPLATARSASRRVIDPPGPEPRSVDGSTPPSLRIRRTTGDTMRPFWAASLTFAARGGSVAVGFEAGDVGSFAVGAPPATAFSSITPTRAPVSTVSPSPAKICTSTPAAGEGISESTLSVETSKSGSSRATASPTFLNHCVMIPSVTDSPSEGSVTSTKVKPSTRERQQRLAEGL